MLYQATHVTKYKYDDPVSYCLSEARLTPRPFPGQVVHGTKLDVQPEPATIFTRKDYFGNDVTRFSVFRSHDEFVTTAVSIVERQSIQRELPVLSWEDAAAQLAIFEDAGAMEGYEFIFDSPYVAASALLAEYARPSFRPGRPLVEVIKDLSHRIHTEFKYQPKATSIDMPLLDILQLRRGVCQDFAHIMIGALRSWRIGARYVSGYLKSGAEYQGAEASHAWVSVYIPGYGWMDVDPTNDAFPGDGHITVAWGRDYGDVSPLKGISLGGGTQAVEVEVSVRPIGPALD